MERRTEITKSGVKWKTMNDKVQCFIIIIIITILYIGNVKKKHDDRNDRNKAQRLKTILFFLTTKTGSSPVSQTGEDPPPNLPKGQQTAGRRAAATSRINTCACVSVFFLKSVYNVDR